MANRLLFRRPSPSHRPLIVGVSSMPQESAPALPGRASRRSFMTQSALLSCAASLELSSTSALAQTARTGPTTREYWIQLENRDWDLVPNNRDRLTGQSIDPNAKVLFRNAL